MSGAENQSVTPADILKKLIETRRVWGSIAVACTSVAFVYALFMSRYWEASQGLVVRQAAAEGAADRPGKFNDLYEMRTFQETLLEVAKSRHVLEATLRKIEGHDESTIVDGEAIEKLRRRVAMTPPGGAEFGKTEVFYVAAKDTDRERAIRLVAELCDQLDERLRELRQQRADSVIVEIAEQVDVAAATLDQQTQQLAEFEANVGADLGELRMLHSAFSGQSDLRQEVVALQRELRSYETKVSDARLLIVQLHEAQSEPQKLIATPNSLLTSQPALQRLKDGLVDAQLTTARLRGTRMDEHPLVIAAVESEARIRNDLFRELDAAIQTAQAQLALDENRLEEINAQLASVQNRLADLAGRRAEYSNRVTAVENSRLLLEQARKSHNEAIAAQAAAKTASLVTRIDNPETGPYPAGPSRASVVMLGMIGGLGLGLGWVFLTTGPIVNRQPLHGNRDQRPAERASPNKPTPWQIDQDWPYTSNGHVFTDSDGISSAELVGAYSDSATVNGSV